MIKLVLQSLFTVRHFFKRDIKITNNYNESRLLVFQREIRQRIQNLVTIWHKVCCHFAAREMGFSNRPFPQIFPQDLGDHVPAIAGNGL